MDLLQGLNEILSADRIKSELIDRVGYASDAGFYQLMPKAVVHPVNETEIIALFRFSQSVRLPLVFRTGGTSLSGQSITDGILVDLSRFWKKIMIEGNGSAVRVQPGITGAMVNAHLKKYNRKIGPDPSSISAAMMGGIISNNASGMCCGVQSNSYHTMRSLRFIMPDSNIFSTENQQDYERFKMQCPVLSNELLDLRESILSNQKLHDKIRRKYKTKNTVGYSLNALIDYEQPLDIFAHLLVGGEGTLAFISEAVLDTIPDLPYKATSLLYFNDIYAACETIQPLIDAGAEMVELMDRASLRAIENMDGMDAYIQKLPLSAAALLIEFQEADLAALNARIENFISAAGKLSILKTPHFTMDAFERDFIWKVRKGLFPSVGAVRARGRTVVLEDLAFPLPVLGDAILDLQKVFTKFAYHDAIIFGHAKDGNIHFVITQPFDQPADLERYQLFLQEVVELVIHKYDGTLKAEHGTGRNMAPFVETEWGHDAYEIMMRIKSAADPTGLLNPGVIINADPEIHLKNIKSLPLIEEEVDKCIECGFCEHKCPSRDITQTPRRRIVVRRALAQMKEAGQTRNYQSLLKQYQYGGLDTCAVDGLCATACPVDINTGDLVKRLRSEKHSRVGNTISLIIAMNFQKVQWSIRFALRAGMLVNQLAGKKAMIRLTTLIRKIFPSFPLWTKQLADPPDLGILKTRQSSLSGKKLVYFPTCISRIFGPSSEKGKSIMETFISVAGKAGIHVIVSPEIKGLCCGQAFSSKGYRQAFAYSANQWISQIWKITNGGEISVATDLSSCTQTLLSVRPVLSKNNQAKFDRLTILDSIEFLHDWVIPVCDIDKKKSSIVIHPVCSLEKMKMLDKFKTVARHFAREVIIPVHAGCCGMAGDRGFIYPELTRSATLPEATEVLETRHDGFYSSSKTCEMAMSEATGKNYESVLYLADASMD